MPVVPLLQWAETWLINDCIDLIVIKCTHYTQDGYCQPSTYHSISLFFQFIYPAGTTKTVRLILRVDLWVHWWTVRKCLVGWHLSHRTYSLAGCVKLNILRAGIHLTLLYDFPCVKTQQWLCQPVWKYISALCIARYVSQHFLSIAVNSRKPLDVKSATTLKKL